MAVTKRVDGGGGAGAGGGGASSRSRKEMAGGGAGEAVVVKAAAATMNGHAKTHNAVAARVYAAAPAKSTTTPRLSIYRDWQGPFSIMCVMFLADIFLVTIVGDWLTATLDAATLAAMSAADPTALAANAMSRIGGLSTLDAGHVFAPHSVELAYFLLAYTFIMVAMRFYDSGSYIFLETVWCCNIGMVLVAYSILANRPMGVAAALIGVSIDQLCWYIDLVGWATVGKFPIGAAKYLVWPNTSFVKKITCTHHVWFLPICFYALRFQLPPYTFLMSCVFTTTASVMSRFFTPPSCVDPADDTVVHYLNINAGYHFWKDVKIRFLHLADEQPAYVYLPFLATFGNALNIPSYGFFVLLCRLVRAAQ